MNRLFLAAIVSVLSVTTAHALNTTANMVRSCQGVSVGSVDNYILRCAKTDEILAVRDGGVVQFFSARDFGDVRGAFIESIPTDDDFIYVNVTKNLPDARYKDQTCYRFITQIDQVRDGFYAAEICEYERPDYYL